MKISTNKTMLMTNYQKTKYNLPLDREYHKVINNKQEVKRIRFSNKTITNNNKMMRLLNLKSSIHPYQIPKTISISKQQDLLNRNNYLKVK